MRIKLSQRTKKMNTVTKSNNFDTLLEEYMSKLEKKVVSQTQQLQTITDNATSCLFMIDKYGRTTFMNPAATQKLGYSFEEIKNKVLYTIIHKSHSQGSSNVQTNCPINHALKNMNQVKDQEDIFIKRDGAFFPVSFSLAPLQQEGKASGAVLEFQDITRRKELERQKDEFISIASHELKTPVTSIKSYAQVLQRRFRKEGNTDAVEMLAKMDSQLNKLTSLISDLLDVTKIEQGKLQFQKKCFDFNELVTEVVEEMQRVTDKHKIINQLRHCKAIYGDRDRIGQVITNLLSNAIKYSPRAEKIIVETNVNKTHITLSVQDFGIGIPQDKQEKVFDRFYRADGVMQETYAGLGLGLYISAEIIKRHDGQTGVKSTEGEGSTFYFTIPIKK